MFVEDVMTRQPVTVTAEARAKEALTRMAGHGVTSLPVVDQMGRIIGVVSEADLIRESVEHDPRAQLNAVQGNREQVPPGCVGDVMTSHAVTVREHNDFADAVDLMTSTGVKSLPVVDQHQHVVGVVSRSDVVKQLARADSIIEAEVDSMMVSLGRAPGWSRSTREWSTSPALLPIGIAPWLGPRH